MTIFPRTTVIPSLHNYRGSIAIPNRGRKPARTATAIAVNTASATANTGHYFRRCVFRWLACGFPELASVHVPQRAGISSAHGNDALHRLLDFSPWGANGDTVNVSMIPLTTCPGGVYFPWLPLKMANIAEHTNRKFGAGSGCNMVCFDELRQFVYQRVFIGLKLWACDNPHSAINEKQCNRRPHV